MTWNWGIFRPFRHSLPLAGAVLGCLALLPATAGAARVVSPPDGYFTPLSQPTFMFDEVNGAATCAIDTDAPVACVSPWVAPNALADGLHHFTITDNGGTVMTSFTVDTTSTGPGGPGKPEPKPPVTPGVPPETTITSGPTGGAVTLDTTPTFAFISDAGAATFSCWVDGGTPFSCIGSVTTAVLPLGPHTFSVVSTDLNGVADPTPAVASFVVSGPAHGSIVTRHTHVNPAGKAKVKLACDAGVGSCAGTLTLTKTIKVRVGKSLKSVSYRFGTAHFSIAAGHSSTITVTLTTTARKLMRRDDQRRLVIRTTMASTNNTTSAVVEYSLF